MFSAKEKVDLGATHAMLKRSKLGSPGPGAGKGYPQDSGTSAGLIVGNGLELVLASPPRMTTFLRGRSASDLSNV